MKRIIFLVIALIAVHVATAQVYQTAPSVYGNSFGRVKIGAIAFLPTGCGVPSTLNSIDSAVNQVAIYFDSCNHVAWWYDPKLKSWDTLNRAGGGGGGGGANNYPTSFSFATGTLTLNRNGLSAITQNLDGRWVKISDSAAMLSPYLRTNIAAATYQPLLTGTGFVKSSAGVISYDNSVYVTTRDRFGLSGEDATAGQNRTYDLGTSYTFSLTGNNALSGSGLLRVVNSGGNAIYSSAPAGSIAVYGTAGAGGVGVYGYGNGAAAVGLYGQSTTGYSAIFSHTSTTTNAIDSSVKVIGLSSGTVANGFGQKITFSAHTNLSGSNVIEHQGGIAFKWSDVTDATRTSQIDLTGINSAATETFLNVQHNLIRFNNNADTVASKADVRAVSSGASQIFGGTDNTASSNRQFDANTHSFQINHATTFRADGDSLNLLFGSIDLNSTSGKIHIDSLPLTTNDADSFSVVANISGIIKKAVNLRIHPYNRADGKTLQWSDSANAIIWVTPTGGTLTSGNGTTASGTHVNLGGTVTAAVNVVGAYDIYFESSAGTGLELNPGNSTSVLGDAAGNANGTRVVVDDPNQAVNIYATNGTNFGNKAVYGYSAKYNVQTGTSYTLVGNDAGKILTFNNASAITLTVPAGLPDGFTCTIVQLGAGAVTFTASSTTINNRNSDTKTAGQFAPAFISMYATNTFVTSGDMTH